MSKRANSILAVDKEHLLLMQVLCWFAPGAAILIKGIKALVAVSAIHPERVWWLPLTAIVVAVIFSMMFNNFIKRYTARILQFPERKKNLFAFFDLKGYILIIFMMCLGISLKYIPFIPIDFFAGFYPGLGLALAIAGIRYLVSWARQLRINN